MFLSTNSESRILLFLVSDTGPNRGRLTHSCVLVTKQPNAQFLRPTEHVRISREIGLVSLTGSMCSTQRGRICSPSPTVNLDQFSCAESEKKMISGIISVTVRGFSFLMHYT